MAAANRATRPLGYYAPMIPPLVPSLVVACIKEIEKRGMTEDDLYQEDGDPRLAQLFVKRYLQTKKLNDLSEIDVPTVTLVLRIFLRSLAEPLVTNELREEFIHASVERDSEERNKLLLRVIQKLPRANRDTLAYLMRHLQRVAIYLDSRVLIKDLAIIFALAVVGGNAQVGRRLRETVVESLLLLHPEHWKRFLSPYQPRFVRNIKKGIRNYIDDRKSQGNGELTASPWVQNLPERPASRFSRVPKMVHHSLKRLLPKRRGTNASSRIYWDPQSGVGQWI
ncbi:rac GTPase-activating protein 1-like [Venturia canescens]|uniref:rac GTPase-activating protein 1-like n=1 Tax=Venturia canescens TaxID=32260 RepID=UPI001C9C7BC3|nr:rac GTPase-activating protein 1-like [Venturia canescens]